MKLSSVLTELDPNYRIAYTAKNLIKSMGWPMGIEPTTTGITILTASRCNALIAKGFLILPTEPEKRKSGYFHRGAEIEFRPLWPDFSIHRSV